MFKVGWSLRREDIEGVTGPCLLPPPPPIKILFVHIGFVGLISGGDAMPGSWVSPSRDDECMDYKIYSESLIENIATTEYLYGCNLCQVQFYKPFSSLQLNWDMKCS